MDKSYALNTGQQGINLMAHPGIAMHEYVVGELASLAAVLGTLAGLLPSIATVFAIMWYSVLLYDRLIARRFRGVPAEKLDADGETRE